MESDQDYSFERKHTSNNSPSKQKSVDDEENCNVVSLSDSAEITKQRKPLGWKTMPFILGDQGAAKLVVWGGLSNFLTVICAFVADAYTGKFLIIVCGSFATILV
ncbi:hypothetical protein Dsin_010152 [Dipteronia sinensis]|uniref:Uncharacterized protein n=1 Tax=Dipteronia sinensis TaxID=43782 RepID=A0AAE0AS70_9ROSI|nr:hypothetical protein Dsin_010152 [Dipteronia sinensis]